MEYFDCSLAGRTAGIDDLFGGSVALGAGTALLLTGFGKSGTLLSAKLGGQP